MLLQFVLLAIKIVSNIQTQKQTRTIAKFRHKEIANKLVVYYGITFSKYFKSRNGKSKAFFEEEMVILGI